MSCLRVIDHALLLTFGGAGVGALSLLNDGTFPDSYLAGVGGVLFLAGLFELIVIYVFFKSIIFSAITDDKVIKVFGNIGYFSLGLSLLVYAALLV